MILDLLITEEVYGWARRKVIEAKISLASYLEEKDSNGNEKLVRSLEAIKEALLILDFGDVRVAQEALELNLTSYGKLIEYIDIAITAGNMFKEKSLILYNVTSNLITTTDQLVRETGRIWGFS